MDLQQLKQSIIGNHTFIPTPFGPRLLTYADYTASGRLVTFIEQYILKLSEYYGNTHTNDSYTGKMMNHLMNQAYNTIKRCLKLTDDYYLIPCGYGTTSAIHKLCQILGLYLPPSINSNLDLIFSDRYHDSFKHFLSSGLTQRPVIFISPYEHHSNDLIWKESLAEVVEIGMREDGTMDLNDLNQKLQALEYEGRIKIGSFSAASNVTGIKTDLQQVIKLMKKHGAYVFFDFAAAAPYVEIDVTQDPFNHCDAFFFSTHKLLGGPGGCGLLIIHRNLYHHFYPPTISGGGTVQYVSPNFYSYINDVETRENAGTPPILQLFKTALALELKEKVGTKRIKIIDEGYISYAITLLKNNPNIIIYGPLDPKKRLPILSFNIRDGESLLHPKFVATLLNDIFGIQTRAGCACAGPYGHRLLGITDEKAILYDQVLKEGMEVFRPGFVRLNFHYTMDLNEVLFITQAVNFIATYGANLLSLYICNVKTGEWKHINDQQQPLTLSIDEALKPPKQTLPISSSTRHQFYRIYLEEAQRYVASLPTPIRQTFKNFKLERLRWFSFVHEKNSTT